MKPDSYLQAAPGLHSISAHHSLPSILVDKYMRGNLLDEVQLQLHVRPALRAVGDTVLVEWIFCVSGGLGVVDYSLREGTFLLVLSAVIGACGATDAPVQERAERSEARLAQIRSNLSHFVEVGLCAPASFAKGS